MKKLRYLLAAFALVPLVGLNSGVSYAEDAWAVDATFSGSCSCDVMCNCSLGSGPTLGFCEGSRLIEISKGHYHGTNLDGLDVVVTRRGGEWAKFYFDETVNDHQMDGVLLEFILLTTERLLPWVAQHLPAKLIILLKLLRCFG